MEKSKSKKSVGINWIADKVRTAIGMAKRVKLRSAEDIRKARERDREEIDKY